MTDGYYQNFRKSQIVIIPADKGTAIVCGNEIGECAFIGAGAVVTKAVPAYALVIGNAAKQIGWVSEYGHRLHFDVAGFAICEESKQQYQLQNNSVSRIA